MNDVSALSSLMRHRLARRSWPAGTTDLLLQAGMAPRAQAAKAWAAWTELRNFDHVSWVEQRLLAVFSDRIGELDPASPLLPRIVGLTKRLWTAAQVTLRQSVDGVEALSAAGIDCMVFKGGALLAEDFPDARRRILGDIDVLIHPEAAAAAVDALTAAGWCSVNGESPAYLRRLAHVRISGNYRKGELGEVDLHITPYHFARSTKALEDALWRDARPAKLGSRPIRVPDPENAIVISLAHGPMSDSAEWAFDVSTRIAHQAIDWDRLAAIAQERDLVPSCLSGLRYLREGLALAVPDRTLTELSRSPVGVGSWMKYWANVGDRKDRTLLEKGANRLADRLLRSRSYSHFRKDRAVVTVTRPAKLRTWQPGRARSLPVPATEWGYQHQLSVGGATAGRRLALRLAVLRPRVSRRIFFDVTAGGVAVGRLRARLGPAASAEKVLTFLLPLPASDATDISIEARPVGFLPPNAAPDLHHLSEALRFRLVSAWIA